MVTDKDLVDLLEDVDRYLKGTVIIIAIGGTAMTLTGMKDSTIDVDLDVPNAQQFKELKNTLLQIGFSNIRPGGSNLKVMAPNGIILDLFSQNYIFGVQLVEPLKTISIKQFKHINLQAIGPYDLIITKTARSDTRDFDDILALARMQTIDFGKLFQRFKNTYDSGSHIQNGPQLFKDMLIFLERKGVSVPKQILDEVKKWAE